MANFSDGSLRVAKPIKIEASCMHCRKKMTKSDIYKFRKRIKYWQQKGFCNPREAKRKWRLCHNCHWAIKRNPYHPYKVYGYYYTGEHNYYYDINRNLSSDG